MILLFVVGCGPAFLPEPTKNAVATKDIAGVWKYFADYEKTRILLELKTDGSFVQTIHHSGKTKPQAHKGNWNLQGNRPKLMLLKPVFGNPTKPWILEEANWWIMDSVLNDNTKFSICGAADDRDPDSCFEMKKIR
jgi:hypothetical protein